MKSIPLARLTGIFLRVGNLTFGVRASLELTRPEPYPTG